MPFVTSKRPLPRGAAIRVMTAPERLSFTDATSNDNVCAVVATTVTDATRM
jgi:hypothetical protein